MIAEAPQTLLPEEIAKGAELPSFARPLFGDQRINIYISRTGGQESTYGIVTEDGILAEVNDKGVEKPTLKVYVEQVVIETIMSAENPLTAFQDALKSKKITYNVMGLGNKIKFTFASLALRVTSFFTKEKEDTSSKEASEGSTITSNVVAKVEPAEEKVSVEVKKEEQKTEGEQQEKTKETEGVLPETKRTEKHQVMMTEIGFDPKVLEIKAGDTVTWELVRSGKVGQGMIIGVRSCREVRSKTFKTGEKFEWTFTKPGTCIIVDGIMSTQDSKIVVK